MSLETEFIIIIAIAKTLYFPRRLKVGPQNLLQACSFETSTILIN